MYRSNANGYWYFLLDYAIYSEFLLIRHRFIRQT